MGRFIDLFLDGITEKKVRDNFQSLARMINEDLFRKGQFKFIEIEVRASGTLKYKHGLGFRPTDIIMLSISKSDTSTVTWKYDSFTRDDITLVASGPCTVRAYIGSYKE